MTNIFDLLSGTWHLQRDIPTLATMEGTARFEVQDADTLTYHETGKLRMAAGSTHTAQQRYIYTRSPDGFSVWFAEEPLRLFHAIKLTWLSGQWVGQAEHLCSQDLYSSTYHFDADGSFTVIHVVNGPRKAYTSTTRFTRG